MTAATTSPLERALDAAADQEERPLQLSDHHRPEIAGFITTIEAMARGGFAEFTVGQLADATGLSKGKLRGVLHTGADLGWIRPVKDDPRDSRVARWTIAEGVLLLLEAYRLSLAEHVAALNDRINRLHAPSAALFPHSNRPPLPEGTNR